MNKEMASKEDLSFMKIALEESVKGEGRVNPNPLVGAVIVNDGEIIGKGYHEFYGGPHAEVNAVADAKRNLIAMGKEPDLEGMTIYVTLEPCSHYGKTPPCADLIVKNRFKRCVVAAMDPNPKVSGNGINRIKEAGIEVEVGILSNESHEINKVFFKYIVKKIPYIFLKCGITLDGKIATENGSSKWITNSKARDKVQEYRNRFLGIMVGKNTVINDNPELKTKMEGGRDPYRIVFDSKLEIPEEYKIISQNSDLKTIIITSDKNKSVDGVEESEKNLKYKRLETKYGVRFITFQGDKFELNQILEEIGKLGIDGVLVEGGQSIISQFFKENLIDAGEIFIAPKILGDSKGISFISGFSRKSIDECINLPKVKYSLYDENIGIQFDFN